MSQQQLLARASRALEVLELQGTAEIPICPASHMPPCLWERRRLTRNRIWRSRRALTHVVQKYSPKRCIGTVARAFSFPRDSRLPIPPAGLPTALFPRLPPFPMCKWMISKLSRAFVRAAFTAALLFLAMFLNFDLPTRLVGRIIAALCEREDKVCAGS